MKKIVSIFLLSSVLFASCKKDEINNTETQVGQSKVIFFPSVQAKGEKFIILNQGQTYTEPGVTAMINGKDVQYETNTTVNTAVPGVYNLVYSAKNAEGYSSSDWRTVVVIGNDVAANDFSGTYLRPGFAASTWTRKAQGVYEVDNPGGAPTGIGFKVIAVNYQGTKIKIPRQVAFDPADGTDKEVSSTSETYNPSSTPVKYSWAFLAGGYGTQVRNFEKQ